jgi:predicted small lipoprotein YifL
MRIMTRQLTALTGFALLAALAACGQSGPLYLPGNPSEVEAPPPTAEEADEEEKDDGDGR